MKYFKFKLLENQQSFLKIYHVHLFHLCLMIPINLLHGYQLENYQITRFLHFAYTHLLFRIKGSQRQKLDRTKKAILLFIVANGLFF